jgi:zinc D-Ala-D-Ala carboxypeptidase
MLQKGRVDIKNNIEDKAGNMHNDKLRNMNIKYFKLSEFDSPDEIGSGNNMCLIFLNKLDKARELAGIPFKINSGYRTPKHNAKIGGVKGSAHTNIPCNAADINVVGTAGRFKIINAALKVGFNRIGIGKTFIHLDTDLKKSQNIIWHYY